MIVRTPQVVVVVEGRSPREWEDPQTGSCKHSAWNVNLRAFHTTSCFCEFFCGTVMEVNEESTSGLIIVSGCVQMGKDAHVGFRRAVPYLALMVLHL